MNQKPIGNAKPIDPWTLAWRQTKRFFAAIMGFTLLIVGGALLFLPGPGILTIAIGLVLLASEFVWARHLLRDLKSDMPASVREELEKKRWHWLFGRHEK